MRKLVKDYLRSSKELLNLLGSTNKDDKIYPNYSKKKAPYLILKIRPQERTIPKVDDLEVKIIDDDVDRQEEIQELILKLLDFGETKGHYKNKTNILYTSHLIGSGELEYEGLGLVEKTLNFEVKWR